MSEAPRPRGARRNGRGRWTAVRACILLSVAFAPSPARSQDLPPLFASDDQVFVTLTADLDQLRDDRRVSVERPGTLTLTHADGRDIVVDVEVRTRGEFRLDPANCWFPPLRLDVKRRSAEGTLFDGQDKLKLVSSCRPGRSAYDPLVHLEYLAYRAYGILTERSFRVRLLRVTFVDSSGEDEPETRAAFVIEEDEVLAERLGGSIFELEEGKNLPASAFDPTSTVMTAIFQYMIGNTDWSDVAGHNIEIVDRAGTAIAVPYDFDLSGLVDAPYATVNPDFGLRNVRERYYRGWCSSPMTSGLVLQRFRESQDAILELFENAPGLDDSVRRKAVRYLSAFFDDIETDERARRRVLRNCRAAG